MLATHHPFAPSGPCTCHHITHGNKHQRHAQQAQCGAFNLRLRRRLDKTRRKQASCQQAVAHPVGSQAGTYDLRNGEVAEASARIQPRTQGHAADQGTQVEIERVAGNRNSPGPPGR